MAYSSTAGGTRRGSVRRLLCRQLQRLCAHDYKPTRGNPESQSSRSAMASMSEKGQVCTTQKPTEFYVCHWADPHAEVHDHSIPNFTVTKGVGLWARVHLKNRRTGSAPLGGRDSSLIKLATSLFHTDCLTEHGGVRRRDLPGGGPGGCTSQRVWSKTRVSVAGAHGQSARAVSAGTLSISSPQGQSAWEGVGVA